MGCMWDRLNNKQTEYDMNDVKLECVTDEKDFGSYYQRGSKV